MTRFGLVTDDPTLVEEGPVGLTDADLVFKEFQPCDSGCGARALWKIFGWNNLPLYFCGHHKHAYEEKGSLKGWTSRLVELDASIQRM